MESVLAAAHGGDDFDAVALPDRRLGVMALWHDLAVLFHRDAFAGIAQFFHEPSHRCFCGEPTRLAVQADVNHRR